MKLMIAVEFGSTGAEEISVFQALSAGNGTKPLRLPPCPVVKALHAALGLPPPGEPPDEPEDEPPEPPALPPPLLEPALDPAFEEDAELFVAVRVVPLHAEISKAAIVSKANGRFGCIGARRSPRPPHIRRPARQSPGAMIQGFWGFMRRMEICRSAS